MRKTLKVAFLYFCAILGQSVAASDLPKPPDWAGHFSRIPDWWTNVTEEKESFKDTHFWKRIHDIERRINDKAGGGTSATRDRQRLIKYMSQVLESSQLKENDIDELNMEIASTYSRLGDYKRSIIVCSELLSKHPAYPDCLFELANNYQCIGDKERAIQIYKFATNEFGNEGYRAAFSAIARTDIACLTGAKMNCSPSKPSWWGEFQSSPDWYTNMQAKLPEFSCFKDGFQYLSVTVAKKHDPRVEIKVWQELSHSVPLTFQDKIMVYLGLAAAYSEIGDPHRSIINAWRVLDEFPSNLDGCAGALRWMHLDFEKLGDKREVAEVERSQDCYSQAVMESNHQ